MLLIPRPEWQLQAACRGMGPTLFFPTRGDDYRPARRICAGCPVAADCLAYGRREHFGVWGGRPERSRRLLAGE